MARRAIPQRRGQRNIEVYNNWIKNLAHASKSRCVVVQSKRAKDVLKSLAVKNVHCWHGEEYQMIDKLCKIGKEVLLIFDTDRNSNAKCQKVRYLMEREGIKVSTRFRKLIFTSQSKTLGGFLKFIHEQVATTPRKHITSPF